MNKYIIIYAYIAIEIRLNNHAVRSFSNFNILIEVHRTYIIF